MLVIGSNIAQAEDGESCKTSGIDWYYPECVRQAVERFAPEVRAAGRISEGLRELERANRAAGPAIASPCPPGGVGPDIPGLSDFLRTQYTEMMGQLVQADLKPEQKAALADFLDRCQQDTERLHLLAAESADAVYAKTPPEGYEIIEPPLDFSESGVKGYLLMPKDGHGPAIITFAGTEDGTDWWQNAHWSVEQLMNAQTHFNEWVRHAYSRLKKRELIVAGHSLGGGLAQSLVGAMRPYDGAKLHLVTFDAFRAMDQFSLYAESAGLPAGQLLQRNRKPLVDAVHYRVSGDLVSLLGHSMGGQSRTIHAGGPEEDEKEIRRYTGRLADIYFHHKMQKLNAILKRDPHALADSCAKELKDFGHPLSATGRFVYRASEKVEDMKNGLRNFAASMNPLRPALKDANEVKHGLSDLDWGGGVDVTQMDEMSSACEEGDLSGCLALAEAHVVKGNLSEAQRWYQHTCDSGGQTACVAWAGLQDRLGYPKAALKTLQYYCEKNQPGTCYEAGRRLKAAQDPSARDYFMKSCRGGLTEACDEVLESEAARKSYAKDCREDQSVTFGEPCLKWGLSVLRVSPTQHSREEIRKVLRASCDRQEFKGCEGLALAESSPEKGITILEKERNRFKTQAPSSVVRNIYSQESALWRSHGSYVLGVLHERKGDQARAFDSYLEECQELHKTRYAYRQLACAKVWSYSQLPAFQGKLTERQLAKVKQGACDGWAECMTSDAKLSSRVLSHLRSRVPAELQNFKEPVDANAPLIRGDAKYRWRLDQARFGEYTPGQARKKIEAPLELLGEVLQQGDTLAFEQLLADGVDVTKAQDQVVLASRLGDTGALQLLLAKGAPASARDSSGESAAEAALQTFHAEELLRALFAAGVDPCAKPPRGKKSLLQIAKDEQQEDAARLIQERCAKGVRR